MRKQKDNHPFDNFALKVTKASGKSSTFIIAMVIVLVWAITGPFFNFSDTWQLVINTGTTIITFLMVFVIQQTQNKATMAIQLKLNELIAANRNASNRLIDIESLTEEDLEVLKHFYGKLSELSRKETNIKKTHSVEESAKIHRSKMLPHNPTRNRQRGRSQSETIQPEKAQKKT